MRQLLIFFLIASQSLHSIAQQQTRHWLDSFEVKTFSEGIPAVVSRTNQAGEPMRMAGIGYKRGLGFNGTSVFPIQLDGKGVSLSAAVGVDDGGHPSAVHKFYVIADRQVLFYSGEMRRGDRPKTFTVDLRGVRRLGLLVLVPESGSTRMFTDWADAQITMIDQAVPRPVPNDLPKYILTPTPNRKPRINGAAVYGARPGSPFHFAVPATGDRPMKFSASGLPAGLAIDPNTGIITGMVKRKLNAVVRLTATNQLGSTSRDLRIRIGDTIALTPPMGWNGWNSWARNIDREKVIASAVSMVKSGLRDHGWSYVNIDDGWQGERDGAEKALQPNAKFPRFKEMFDTIHAMGLKGGIYSTPWITSYAGFAGGSTNTPDGSFPDSVRDNKRAYRYIGTHRYEQADARQFAAWGVDYLKYDWRIETESAKRMSEALKASGRDIVYSLSNSAPFSYVDDWIRFANMHRTGPDIRDSWHALYRTVFHLDKWAPYNGPGHWNDPDMMVLGNVTTGSPMHPTRLTPDEQYSEVSMFALLSAPMLIGCPIDQLDPFTLSLLTNDEVIAIDQDPLGRSARKVRTDKGVETWLKPMEDGSYVIGLFNTAFYGETPQSHFRWGDETPVDHLLDLKAIGINQTVALRDVWRQQDLAPVNGQYRFRIPHHGVVLLRTRPMKSASAAVWNRPAFNIPAVASESRRLERLRDQWNGFNQDPPRVAVRDGYLFLLDALDADFLKDEEVEWLLRKLKSRVITDSAAASFGNMYWGWHETGGDVGDGNNVQFCVQYGALIRVLFDDRLSPASRALLDEIFGYAISGMRRQPIRVSYTNIYVMRIWNMLVLGQLYQDKVLIEEARTLMDTWIDHVARHGNREYDSPTYLGVDLESLLLIQRFAQDARMRKQARDAVDFLMTDILSHYNARGRYLAGAHSRDYNRVFGRDLLEERYIDPLLGGVNRNDMLFHQVCFSLLKEIGISKAQRELMSRNGRIILQRWDSMAHTYAYDYQAAKFSIASSNQYYSPDDKSFVMYLGSDRIPRMPNIIYVPEGRDDHYGTWSALGLGDKLKHLMPPNYPSNGGWGKTRHLMPFQQTVQGRNQFVMLVAGEKDHNCITDRLNSTVVLPACMDEWWMGNQRINKPAVGASVPMDNTRTLFARFEDVAFAIRILWSNAETDSIARLYNDGYVHRSHREDVTLDAPEALRLTLKHPSNGKMAISMWWKAVEGIKSDAAFAAFRASILKAPVNIKLNGEVIDVRVTADGKPLGLKADLKNKTRLAYYGGPVIPKDFLLKVDGVELGRPIMDKHRKSLETWVDSVDRHAREVFMPADKYKWDWGQATMLNALVHRYNATDSGSRGRYLEYIRRGMEQTAHVANGKHPNAVASAHGIAFLARVTGDPEWKRRAMEIYKEYLAIPREPGGGVSHRAETVELWDDTVYMLAMYLLEMYRLTGDERFVADWFEQFRAHDKALRDDQSGLWVHGWDADSVFFNDGCSVLNWPDAKTHRNDQIWARGNGWVGMALADALEVLPASSPLRKPIANALLHYVKAITPYQNPKSGHWYQLLVKPELPRNFEESSATAMFGYTIVKGLKLGVLDPAVYRPMADRAYYGLRSLSMRTDKGGAWLVPTRVSGGTCVGDQDYYLNRRIMEGTAFGYGAYIMFGQAYEQLAGIRK